MATQTIEKKRQTVFRLEESLVDRLKKEAYKENRSLNNYVEAILEDFVKMPDLKITKKNAPNQIKTKFAMLSDEELFKLAYEIKASMNHNAPIMSMEEIVQEVRDYRNGKLYAKIDKGIEEYKQRKTKKLDVNNINSFLGL